MPHNNRMSTSGALQTSAIWQTTIGCVCVAVCVLECAFYSCIGDVTLKQCLIKACLISFCIYSHDPYAGQEDSVKNNEPSAVLQAEAQQKSKEVLAVARQQNLTGDANRDDFAQRLYRGLKTKKGRTASVDPNAARDKKLLESDTTSSSEEEMVAVVVQPKKKHKKEKKPKRKRQQSDDGESDSESDDSRRRSRKHRHKRKSSRRQHTDPDSGDESNTNDYKNRLKKRKEKRTKRKPSNSSSDDDTASEASRRKQRRDKKRKKEYRQRRKDDDESDRKLKKPFQGDRYQDSSSEVAFIPSKEYDGPRVGYSFKSGDQGIGYYVDQPPTIDQQQREEMLQLYSID
jgi:hypothetical protein